METGVCHEHSPHAELPMDAAKELGHVPKVEQPMQPVPLEILKVPAAQTRQALADALRLL